MTETSQQSYQVLYYLVAARIGAAAAAPRNNPSAGKTRESLRTILAGSFADARIDADAWRYYMFSDTVLVAVNPGIGAEQVVEKLPRALLRHVKRHNSLSGPTAQLRLRLALSQGTVPFDEDGPYGIGVEQTLRLLDAPAFVAAWQDRAGTDLAVAVSDRVYDDLVVPGDLSPRNYERVDDETSAWITFPGATAAPPITSGPVAASVAGAGVRDFSRLNA